MSDPMPTVGPVTAAVYTALPEVYRTADAAQDSGPSNYPLLRYLALLLDQLTPLAELLDRISYVPLDDRHDQPVPESGVLDVSPPWQRYGTGTYGAGTYGDEDTSALVDPTLADAAWLPWLARLTGVNIAGLTAAQARARMFNPSASWAHGTIPVLRQLTRDALSDPDAYVNVIPHWDTPYGIGIITKTAETGITPTALLAALEVERPVGFALFHRYDEDLLGVS